MADMKHCDNNACNFAEDSKKSTIKRYRILMQNEKDGSDVLYLHSIDLCPDCVEKVRTAMKSSIEASWTEYKPSDRKNIATNGNTTAVPKQPAVVFPVENITGIGKNYDYLKEANVKLRKRNKKPKEIYLYYIV